MFDSVKIFDGEITKWNDPAIKSLQADSTLLPDENIVVLAYGKAGTVASAKAEEFNARFAKYMRAAKSDFDFKALKNENVRETDNLLRSGVYATLFH